MWVARVGHQARRLEAWVQAAPKDIRRVRDYAPGEITTGAPHFPAKTGPLEFERAIPIR